MIIMMIAMMMTMMMMMVMMTEGVPITCAVLRTETRHEDLELVTAAVGAGGKGG